MTRAAVVSLRNEMERHEWMDGGSGEFEGGC